MYQESQTVLHTHQNISQHSKRCGRIHPYKRYTSSDTLMHLQTTWNSMSLPPLHRVLFFYEEYMGANTSYYYHSSFFESVDRLYRSDYIPDDADILRCRVKSTGITETTFHLGTLTYRYGEGSSHSWMWKVLMQASISSQLTTLVFTSLRLLLECWTLEDSVQNAKNGSIASRG